MSLIETWRADINRLWSMRLAIAQAAIGAFATAWAVYDPSRHLTVALAVLLFVLGLAIAVARMVRQKGPNDGDCTQQPE